MHHCLVRTRKTVELTWNGGDGMGRFEKRNEEIGYNLCHKSADIQVCNSESQHYCLNLKLKLLWLEEL
jgi:hypothetical protein